MTRASKDICVTRLGREDRQSERRSIPVEVPISIEFNGIGYAVMMASPTDLGDFATGFALSERVIASAKDIHSVSATETQKGWILRIQVPADRMQPVLDRVRTRVSESSCGVCGLENLDQVAKPLPPLPETADIEKAALFAALDQLQDHQSLNRETGGVHAAAFCLLSGDIQEAREDVGRHNALDKLIGALARQGLNPSSGFFLLSSRCSYELVEKTVIAGCPLLVTISTATSLAVERAREARLRLVALARPDAMLDFSCES